MPEVQPTLLAARHVCVPVPMRRTASSLRPLVPCAA